MPFLKKHGRHHPCCGGACLVARTGCSLNMLPVSFLLIVGPSALWLLRVAPALGYSAAVSAVGIALLALSLLNLFACYLTEPGLLRVVDAAGASPDERPRKLVVAGVGPPRELVDFRAKFCRETGNVVEVFDHFCPWTGNAVGRRNYLLLLLFGVHDGSRACGRHHLRDVRDVRVVRNVREERRGARLQRVRVVAARAVYRDHLAAGRRAALVPHPVGQQQSHDQRDDQGGLQDESQPVRQRVLPELGNLFGDSRAAAPAQLF